MQASSRFHKTYSTTLERKEALGTIQDVGPAPSPNAMDSITARARWTPCETLRLAKEATIQFWELRLERRNYNTYDTGEATFRGRT